MPWSPGISSATRGTASDNGHTCPFPITTQGIPAAPPAAGHASPAHWRPHMFGGRRRTTRVFVARCRPGLALTGETPTQGPAPDRCDLRDTTSAARTRPERATRGVAARDPYHHHQAVKGLTGSRWPRGRHVSGTDRDGHFASRLLRISGHDFSRDISDCFSAVGVCSVVDWWSVAGGRWPVWLLLV
jgi:hypothetical protein